LILQGFTANQEKECLLNLIKASRSFIRTFSDLIAEGSTAADEYHTFITHEQAMIKRNMAKLVELERFRIKEGLEPNEKYRLPRREDSRFRR
jgi:hypothetical protein